MKSILNHKYRIELLVLVLTIFKIVLVYFFFQNIIIFENGIPKIAPGYAWSELVTNMQNGEYYNTSQYSLSEMYDMKYHALRPPLYGTFLYLIAHLGSMAAVIGVAIQSFATSLIAYFSFLIIKKESENTIVPFLSLLFVFFLPFNFFKSGTLDDAVFMLLFLLIGIYCFLKALETSKINIWYIISGISFGLALLTRSAALFVIFGSVAYAIIKYRKNLLGIGTLILLTALIVSPWIIRNYNVIGKAVHTNGRGRVLLLMQSEDFIQNFPYKSIDVIDRSFYIKNHDKYSYINELPEKDKDSEFMRLAIEDAIENPMNLVKSMMTKLKAFVPFDYYPVRGDWLKTVIFLFSYWSSVILFLTGLIISRKSKSAMSLSLLFILIILSFSCIGFIGFMLSRHFYALIVFLLISTGISFSKSKLKFLEIDRFR